MEINYRKLYSYLVSQIDDALQCIAGELTKNSGNERDTLLMAGNKLKDALLTAEDMYLDMEE